MAKAEVARRSYPLRAVVMRTAAWWLMALVVLGVAFWMLDRGQHASTQRAIGAQQRTLIDQASSVLAATLQIPIADLPYLADRPAVRHWLRIGKPELLEQVAVDLLTLARHRPNYAKLRLFGADGQEMVRVNQDEAGPRLVSERQLQDKSDRYFVRDGLAQPSSSIHVSRFDLNVDGGRVEQPYRPMLRFGLPVIDVGGARGLITVNYSGRALLEQLSALSTEPAEIGVWLVDPEGYWLLAQRPEEAWAFEFAPSGKGARFGDRYGAAWSQLRNAAPGSTGQAEIDGDLFTWRRVLPAPADNHWQLTGPGADGWLLVTRSPRRVVAAAAAGQHRLLLSSFGALAFAMLPAAFVLAHYQIGRRQHWNRLQASETRFREMLGAVPDAVVILDGEGRINLVNAQAERQFGYRSDELVGQLAEILVPERLRAQFAVLSDTYLAAPRVQSLGANSQLTARRKDGSEFEVELALSPVATDEGGMAIAVVRDVTERRQLEQAREDARFRHQQLFDNLPLGIFRSSLTERMHDERHFLEVNPALVTMFEAASAARLLACCPADLYHDERQRAALVAELYALGAVTGRELQMVTLQGRVFDARMSVVMRRDGDGSRFVDGVIEDVSMRCAAERDRDRAAEEARRKAAALESANRELEAFSYTVSHDLRAPLRAMDGFSRILEQEYGDRLDAEGKSHLARVRRGAQHMAALIDDLLKLSQVTRRPLHPSTVDLTSMALELTASFDEREPKRSVEWHIAPGLMARGDARLLRVALDNLFDNAWKFSRKRDPAMVEFGSRREEQTVVYYVRDNGVGFDMAYADNLFGPFQRLHDACEFPGTGIGLATVQRVIAKHHGRIWVEAAEDNGATFYFTLGTQEAT